MSQTKEQPSTLPLPFNWAKMSLGEQRDYLCDAKVVQSRLQGIVSLTEGYLKEDRVAHQDLLSHFECLQHQAKIASSYVAIQVDACQKTGVSVFSETEKELKDVHTEHCCAKHGCKYGDETCTVDTGIAPQSYPCPYCADGEDYY